MPDISATGYGGFIENNIGDTSTVSDEEHVAFLLFWLHHSFLCNMSFAIIKGLLPLARLLHEGQNVCLGKILFSSLYESLTNIYTDIKASFFSTP